MMSKKIIPFLIFFVCIVLRPYAFAEENANSEAFRSTAYPLPRFVSLRSDEAYVRTGPGRKYPVKWVFNKKGLPVEIILEYDAWRKIQDFEGAEGWIHKSLLSGKRTGFVRSEESSVLYKKSNKDSAVQALLEPNSLINVEKCLEAFCMVNASGYKGWLQKNVIWGVYENEKFD